MSTDSKQSPEILVAWRRRSLTAQEILASKMVNHPLTQFMFCSPGEGATALVLARGARLRGSFRPPVLLRSVALRTRSFGSFEVFSPSIALESGPSPRSAKGTTRSVGAPGKLAGEDSGGSCALGRSVQ